VAKIDWDSMTGGNYIELKDGVQKVVVLSNWQAQTKFKEPSGEIKPGISFDVLDEDGVLLDVANKKDWTVTAKGALRQLQPIIEKTEAAGLIKVKVSVIRIGEKTDTKYSIKEVPEIAPAPGQPV